MRQGYLISLRFRVLHGNVGAVACARELLQDEGPERCTVVLGAPSRQRRASESQAHISAVVLLQGQLLSTGNRVPARSSVSRVCPLSELTIKFTLGNAVFEMRPGHR